MFLILVALFLLFVGLLKMPVQPVQSILVQNRQEKHDYGYKKLLWYIQGVKFCKLGVSHAAFSLNFCLTTRFLSIGGFEEQVLSSPAAVRRDPGSS